MLKSLTPKPEPQNHHEWAKNEKKSITNNPGKNIADMNSHAFLRTL